MILLLTRRVLFNVDVALLSTGFREGGVEGGKGEKKQFNLFNDILSAGNTCMRRADVTLRAATAGLPSFRHCHKSLHYGLSLCLFLSRADGNV